MAKPLPLWPLPLACAGLFLLTTHLSYLLAVASGQLSWCLLYGLDCVSISATGRELPAKLLFKPLLSVAAMLALAYWLLMGRWLSLQGSTGATPRAMVWLGGVAALCLAAYIAALGEGGDAALLLRRAGAVLGFSLNFLAQLLLTAELRRSPQWRGRDNVVGILWGLLVLMLVVGVASALMTPFAWHSRIDNGVEWWLALLLQLHTALTTRLWRHSGYRLLTSVEGAKGV